MKTSKITGKRIIEYLGKGKRFDGRKLDEYRNLSIETGVSKNAEGSARVKLGETEVLVGIKMGMGTPYPDSPDKGNMMVTVELLPLSSPKYELGPPQFNSIEMARVLDRVVRESKYIQLDKLCVEKGEKVWTVFIDVYAINDAGNLFDAAGFGIMAALKNAKIPKYDTKAEKVLFGELSDKSLPVAKNNPLSLTYSKIGEHIIVDPTTEEEDLIDTRVTIGSSNGIISSMQKGKEVSLEIEEFNKILDLNEVIWKEMFKKFEKELK
ncbi:exosome complex protein Rrp42 [Candidatus Woesearchaeota archaeon]|jgi:exosome complex component RRP42|nr:exosome complex protein Rrp42 [Candidatus Woesearchaeota archaeon]